MDCIKFSLFPTKGPNLTSIGQKLKRLSYNSFFYVVMRWCDCFYIGRSSLDKFWVALLIFFHIRCEQNNFMVSRRMRSTRFKPRSWIQPVTAVCLNKKFVSAKEKQTKMFPVLLLKRRKRQQPMSLLSEKKVFMSDKAPRAHSSLNLSLRCIACVLLLLTPCSVISLYICLIYQFLVDCQQPAASIPPHGSQLARGPDCQTVR